MTTVGIFSKGTTDKHPDARQGLVEEAELNRCGGRSGGSSVVVMLDLSSSQGC